MSTSLSAITNANTFGQWKDRTNQIITALGGTVTIGDSETNTGNIVIDGNISGTGTLFIDTIDATSSNASNLIAINADAKLTGELQINSTVATEVKYYLSDTLTWTVGTNATHTQFDIKKGTARLRIDEGVNSAGTITGVNLTIADDLLPDIISSDITGNAATATAWDTGRTIELTGDVIGTSGSFDGSGNLSFAVAVADNSHNHTISNVTDLSTTLSGKLSTGGGTLTGSLKINDEYNLQLGTDATTRTTLRQGTFSTVSDCFSIVTTGVSGVNPDAYWSLPGSTLYIANNIDATIALSSTGSIVAEGDITAFGTVSDITRKENIVKIEGALDKIAKVSGYTYNYIGNSTPMTGVIAQEFEEVLPQVVYETKLLDGTMSKAVRHGNIVGLLIEAIKELKAEIEELKKDK
jgi:hypothetical protein